MAHTAQNSYKISWDISVWGVEMLVHYCITRKQARAPLDFMCILEIFVKVSTTDRNQSRERGCRWSEFDLVFCVFVRELSLLPVAWRHLASWMSSWSSRKCWQRASECRWQCRRWDCRHIVLLWWSESTSTAALWWRRYVVERRHCPFEFLGSWNNPLIRQVTYTWLRLCFLIRREYLKNTIIPSITQQLSLRQAFA